jgi:ABC-type molybdate transport system substrate-binding protein
MVGRDRAAVMRYLDFLRGPAARAIFEKFGFSVLAKSQS